MTLLYERIRVVSAVRQKLQIIISSITFYSKVNAMKKITDCDIKSITNRCDFVSLENLT